MIIAPIMLVAANSTARSTIAKKIVAIIATRSTESTELMQQAILLLQQFTDAIVIRRIARYTTAMPKTTHKNAGVTVIAAVIVRNAVMMPTTMLTMSATVVQVFLHAQLLFDIISPPDTLYVLLSVRCKRGTGAQAKSEGFCGRRPQGACPPKALLSAPEPHSPSPQTKLKQLPRREAVRCNFKFCRVSAVSA